MAGWEERFDDYVERLGDVLGVKGGSSVYRRGGGRVYQAAPG